MAAGRDQCYWTEELFPPKFTSEDLFFKSEAEENQSNTKIANDFYTQIYLKVIEEERQQKEVEDEEHKRNSKQISGRSKNVVAVDVNSSESSIDKDFKATLVDYIGNKAFVSNNVKKSEIWSGEEVHILRKAYKELRDRSLWLVCVLENRNVKIEDLKSRVKKTEHEKSCMEKEIYSLKKVILKMQAEKSVIATNSKELEEKLEFYEDCNNGLKDAIKKLQEEINQLKKSNRKKDEQFLKYGREKETEISALNKSKKDLLESLPKEYEIQIECLQRNIDELKQDLQSKEQECSLHLSSLKSLEKHFSEIQDKQTPLPIKTLKHLKNLDNMFAQSAESLNRERIEVAKNDFLNVTDI